MATCNGQGDRNGDHCCYVRGEVCEALTYVKDLPRCSFMLAGAKMSGNPEFEKLPIGKMYAQEHPGFDCYDWPQNIPNLTGGKCCWNGEL